MEDVIGKIMTQPEKVEHIINGCCEYFGLKREDLQKNIGSRSVFWYKKRYMVVLLMDKTVLNAREIQSLLGYKERSTVVFHYENVKDELSDKVYGSQKTKMIYNELLNYLKL